MTVETIEIVIILIFAIVVHEYAHGWVAYRLGDSTAKQLGRLTLNPLKHVDPVGTIIFPALLILMKSPFIFGWAKPVPINFRNLRHPKRDIMWVGLAGPAINIVIAVFCSLLMKLPISGHMEGVLALAILINLILAVFNLLPIPPLDGSRFVMGLLPLPYARNYAKLEPYGIIIVCLLLFFGVLENVVWPVVVFLAGLLGVH